jgi:hypothetical protein
VQLNSCFIVHGILDDTKESLVCAFANDNSLSNELITTKAAWWRHGSSSAVGARIECRIQSAEIRALCLSATALCSHGEDILTANHEDTLVLNKLAVLNEEDTSVNVEDLAGSVISAVFFDVVIMSDFGAVAVSGYSVAVSASNLRYLGMEEGAHVAVLVDDSEDFAVDSDYTSDG